MHLGLLVLAGASGCTGELVVEAGTCAAGMVAAAAASLGCVGCVASDDALVGWALSDMTTITAE